MRRFFYSYLLLMFSFSLNATTLPPEHESARLMLSLEDLVSKQSWQEAQTQLKALSDLKINSPLSYHYFYGLVHFHLNHFLKAQQALEHYVINAGKSGKYYDDSLKLITLSEAKAHIVVKHEERSVEGSLQPLVKPDGYIKSLEALYLTDSPIEALSFQINSLLSSNPYTGSRVKKATANEGVKYKLSVNKNNLMIQEKSFNNGLPVLSANTININGLDPFIKYECSKKEFACWLYDPEDEHLRWIKIDHDEMVASELSKALAKLIQRLQTSL